MESVEMLLQQKLLYAPNHEFGMVMFNTAGETSNYVNDKDTTKCQNVQTVRTISKIDLEFMRELPGFTASFDQRQRKGGDLVDGLQVAIQMLDRHCGTKKYRKRVFLITDGEK